MFRRYDGPGWNLRGQNRFFRRGIEMLGHRFAPEPARNRSNRRTYDGAYRPGSDGADRRTRGNTARDTAGRCSKADSNRVRAWGARYRVRIRFSVSCLVIAHVNLRCTVEHGALSVGICEVDEYQPKDEILVGQTRLIVGRSGS